MRMYTLYFGQSVPNRSPLTEAEFAAFVADTVTPRLADGFTLWDATGAWLNPKTNRTITERSKVLSVAVPDRPDRHAAIDAIRRDYEARFHQQLVGMTVHSVCADF